MSNTISIMDVEKAFHMTGGFGNTSYAQNSSYQKKAADLVKHITKETIQQLYITTNPKSLGLADLGCSCGPNTLSTIKNIIDWIDEITINRPPEIRVYLNDLPSNDFNSVFKELPKFYKEMKQRRENDGGVFIGGYPGSFYGRLFPQNSLHFVYSSYSLHWLTKVPPSIYDEQGNSINKGNIYISETSPLSVAQAYTSQFIQDFSLFLHSRSQEIMSGGKMILILLGRIDQNHVDRGNSFYWKLFNKALANLVSQGKVDQEKVDSYEVHFYAPSEKEMKDVVERDGRFKINGMEMFEVQSDESKDIEGLGLEVALGIRAVQESMLSHHFGLEILDILFQEYAKLVSEEMVIEKIRGITFVLVLTKL